MNESDGLKLFAKGHLFDSAGLHFAQAYKHYSTWSHEGDDILDESVNIGSGQSPNSPNTANIQEQKTNRTNVH